MLTFYVYMLRCNDGSYYTGHTDNIESRISAYHQGKGCAYTSKRLPIEGVYVDVCGTRYEALANEHRIKKWSRAKKEALSLGDFKRLKSLAKKNFEKK